MRNRSDQFEARLSTIEIAKTPSILLAGMDGSRIPIAVSHGEGRVEFASDGAGAALEASNLVAARFVDHDGRATERYPENPNGSFHGITAVTTTDGRVTIFMPHPERVFRTRAALVAPARVGREQPLDADLPERAPLGRVKLESLRAGFLIRREPQSGGLAAGLLLPLGDALAPLGGAADLHR